MELYKLAIVPIFNCLFTKSSDILNKNTKGAKKGKANQKQQLSTKKFDITQRPRSLEHNDIANVDNVYS